MRKSFMFLFLGSSLAFLTAQAREEWVARYNGPGDCGDDVRALAVDAAGNVYVTGSSQAGKTGYDYATIKYDPGGNEVWVARYHGPATGPDVATALAVDAAGNVYVTGLSWGVGTVYDYATIKYDSEGNEVWVARYNGPGNFQDAAVAIALDATGNLYVTGRSGGAGTSDDSTTIKYDPEGNEVWVARYNGPLNSRDVTSRIVLDAAGNVYVTGYSRGIGTDYDYVTIKYDPAGNEVWVARYNGPGNMSDIAYAIALDAAGNVYVTGQSWGGVVPGTYDDYATIKYDPEGNEVWVARYNGPRNQRDGARALAVDTRGNVYVTGTSQVDSYVWDYVTLKYDPEGKRVWEARYNGPGKSSSGARALALDSDGNVYVTGSSQGVGTLADYLTVKYDPAGNAVWQARYNGPGNSDDAATALALDGAGNVYVAGWSDRYYGNADYATIKYSQSANAKPE